jgi:hypothetical protein
VKHIAGQRIYEHSDKCEFLAATAGLVRLVLDHNNLLSVKYRSAPRISGSRCLIVSDGGVCALADVAETTAIVAMAPRKDGA